MLMIFNRSVFRRSLGLILLPSLLLALIVPSEKIWAQDTPAAAVDPSTPATQPATDKPATDKPAEINELTSAEEKRNQLQQAETEYRQAKIALQSRDWKTAISQLESALKLAPENGIYHHALGVAYMGDQQSNAGWFHFRQAVRLSPGYVPAAVDFMKTWKLLDAQGVFNVGTNLPLIIQTLGKPDQANDQGMRLRLVYGFMSLNFMNGQLFSILDLRELPESGLHAVDGLAFDLDESAWKVAYRILSATQGNTEYVKAEENLQQWTELFASQRFINSSATRSAQDVMQGIRERLEASFATVNFQILQESAEDTLFIWMIEAEEDHVAQQEVVRIVKGERDIHRLAYTRKGKSVSVTELQPWIEILKSARLLTADQLRAHVQVQEREMQEKQLREVSVQILNRQFELIREGKVEDLKIYFVTAARERITPELLGQVADRLDQLDPEKMVRQVDLAPAAEGLKAHLIDDQGKRITTLIQTDGRWFAEDIWLETVVK